MTLDELQARVIYQVNADADDLPDYEPHLTGYINNGYDLLLYALTGVRAGAKPFPYLAQGLDASRLPEWCNSAVADYATWLVYRNGNPQKQSRGQAYLYAFQQVESKCKSLADRMTFDQTSGDIMQKSTRPPQFFNVYP